MWLQDLSRFGVVASDDAERRAHARDLWPLRSLELVAGKLPPAPKAVVWPERASQLRELLAWATRVGVPVVPWGAGSGVCGAAEGRSDAICVDLKRMRGITPPDPERRVVRVQAGVLGQHLEDALAREGWATRHSPSSIWCSTVGGWAASRSAGQFSSRYGKFEDMVHRSWVATPTGEVEAGRGDQPGDLGPWFMGSEGALGIIHELEVSIVPFPRRRWVRGFRFASVQAAWLAMRTVLQAELRPAVLRLYDPVDTRLAGKGTATRPAEGGRWLAGLTRAVESVPALRRHLLSLPLALPKLLNALAGAAASGCVLLVGWEGDDGEEPLAAEGWKLCRAAGGVDLGEGPGEHWYEHRHEVSYKLAPIFERGGFADTMEVATLWSGLSALHDGVRAALGAHALVMAHFSHAYREGCSIYFTFAGTGGAPEYLAAWADALAAAARAGATVAHHHGVGQLKMRAAGRELAGVEAPFRELKRRFDPGGVLNPGRLFPDQDLPEPPAPAVGVDAESRVATLPASADPRARAELLAAHGMRLRFETPGPAVDSRFGPRLPDETRILGASLRLGGRRVVLPAVPRSAAGPDPRAWFPEDAYETVTLPLVPASAS